MPYPAPENPLVTEQDLPDANPVVSALACPSLWELGRRGATPDWQDLGQLSRRLPFGPWGPGILWGALHVIHD